MVSSGTVNYDNNYAYETADVVAYSDGTRVGSVEVEKNLAVTVVDNSNYIVKRQVFVNRNKCTGGIENRKINSNPFVRVFTG